MSNSSDSQRISGWQFKSTTQRSLTVRERDLARFQKDGLQTRSALFRDKLENMGNPSRGLDRQEKSFLLDFPLHTTQKWQGRNIFHDDKFIYFQSAKKWAVFYKFATKRQWKKPANHRNSLHWNVKTSCSSSMLYKKQYHSPFPNTQSSNYLAALHKHMYN